MSFFFFYFCADRKASEKDLAGIAQAIGLNWEMLGASLGVSKVTIEQIKMDHRYSTVEQIYYMLVEWKRNKGGNATLEKLFAHFQESQSTSINWEHIEENLGLKSKN